MADKTDKERTISPTPNSSHSSSAGKRRTVGDRLGSVVTASTMQLQPPPNQDVKQLTQMLKQHCGLEQPQQGAQQQPWRRDREVLFNPPWETKIGQLQQVVRAIHRNSDLLLDNRGAVIVRCYPYRSTTYMHLVYNLIYATLASNNQFGPMQAPTEIRPILLNYNNMPINLPTQPAMIATHNASFAPYFAEQQQWTDFVLIRVHFTRQEPAMCFMQYFNRMVGRVFDRRQVRAPFAHPDLTRPERMLRNHLQNLCNDKNAGSGANARPPPQQSTQFNRGGGARQQIFYNSRMHTVQNPYAARYYHNGIQLYKEFPNGRTEMVSWEPFSEAQYLHVLVASLRKYAPMYKQKECSVIIQNIAEITESREADQERISGVVYAILSTEAYRQRCANVKNALDQRAKHDPNSGTTGAGDAASPLANPTSHLPLRIERLPRRAPPPGTATREDEKEKTQMQQRQQQLRQPLVRVQFRTIEAAIAFCQIFKEFHLQHRNRQEQKHQDDFITTTTDDGTDDGDGQQQDDTDSYSDLSDLEVFSSGGEQDKSKDEEDKTKEEKKQQKKKKDKKTTKKGNKRGKQQQQPVFFSEAFAHRDLTPPELALGYALRQYCREHNGVLPAELPPTSSGSAAVNNANFLGRFYTRAGRVFERAD